MKNRIKRKKVLLLVILVALAGIITLYFSIGQLKPIYLKTDNISFSKDGFVEASDLSRRDVLVGSNSQYELHFDEKTTYFYVKDTINDKIWHSNPQETDTFPSIILPTKINQKSTLTISYVKGNTIKEYNNYKYSIEHEDGMSTFSIKYLENAVQILYRIEDTEINYTYFPQYLSEERMNSLFLDKDILSDDDKKRLTNYYQINEEGNYELQNYEDISGIYIKYLYKYFYEMNGYTQEDCIKDNAEFGKIVSFERPYFEIAVEYALTDNGFKATVINDSIVEDPKFKMVSIDFLPYFGATTLTDEGYFVIPDGSGATMNFNNGKYYTSPYSKDYYGHDLALYPTVKPENSQELLLPIYGIVNTSLEYAMLAIIEKGAPMTSLYADVSERIDSYNRIYLKFNYRESEKVTFRNSGKELNLSIWTKTQVKSDFVVCYDFLVNDDANYYSLAKNYQQYLIDNQGLEDTDDTDKTVMNLKLLGMYEKREFFFGVPYTTTKTLTTFDEAKIILDELNDNNVNNINLIYDGWFNDGIDHKIPTDIKINGVIGGEKDFQSLIDYTNEHGIGFYPSVNIMKVNQFEKVFDSIRYTSKHINGKTSTVNRFELATKIMWGSGFGTDDYVLKPNYYNSLVTEMLEDYDKLNIGGITINDLGSEISADYRKYEEIFRVEDQIYQENALDIIDKNYNMMMYAPYGYAIQYATDIINLPQDSSQYPILDSSIPFYQLVLNGYKDYAGFSINENVEKSIMYYKLKAIETGSNVNYIWSYKDSSVLLDTSYDYYYSTNYKNWINGAKQLIHELDNLGIHESIISSHEILADGVYVVTYDSGLAFIINYNPTPILITNNGSVIEVPANNYLQL